MKQPPSEDAMELAIKLFPTAGDDDLDVYATQIDAFAARKLAEAERGWRDQDIEARALIRRAAELIKTSANVGGTGKSLAQLEVEADDPQWDGTDAAHPAWWRGNDRGCRFVTQLLTDALDGKDDGGGWMGYPPLEALRRRLLALRSKEADVP
jgi:hypothetical protein